MFRLALCGKNYELLEKIKSHIQSFAETYKNETKCILIEQYKQLASLCDDMVDGIHFDILMVEIDAHPHEDFRLLSEIRKTATDTIVILFSKFLDYDFTRLGYQVGAFRYLSTHNLFSDLPEALCTALEISSEKQKGYYTFSHYSEIIRIPLDDILYVKRVNRITMIKAKNGNFHLQLPLKEIYKEINDSRFLFIDRSCFVNIDHVTCFADAEVKLDNQESLPISHSNFTAIRSVLLYKTPNEIQQPVR